MTNAPHEHDEGQDADELAAIGADFAGALVGGTVGLLGGPVGLIGGAALGVAAQRAAHALGQRLTRREQERVGATLVLIDQNARERQERGERPRADGFFDERGGLRPEAEELLEGVLRQAAGEWEERKVPLLARLYTGVAFEPDVSSADATYMVRLAGDLTYRQLVALAAISDPEMTIEGEHSAVDDRPDHPSPGVEAELRGMADLGLIGVRPPNNAERVHHPRELWGGAVVVRWELTARGRVLSDLAGLDELISAQELDEWQRARSSDE